MLRSWLKATKPNGCMGHCYWLAVPDIQRTECYQSHLAIPFLDSSQAQVFESQQTTQFRAKFGHHHPKSIMTQTTKSYRDLVNFHLPRLICLLIIILLLLSFNHLSAYYHYHFQQ